MSSRKPPPPSHAEEDDAPEEGSAPPPAAARSTRASSSKRKRDVLPESEDDDTKQTAAADDEKLPAPKRQRSSARSNTKNQARTTSDDAVVDDQAEASAAARSDGAAAAAETETAASRNGSGGATTTSTNGSNKDGDEPHKRNGDGLKMPAVAVVAAAAASAGAVPTVDDRALRLPAQRTPGTHIRETKRLRRRHQDEEEQDDMNGNERAADGGGAAEAADNFVAVAPPPMRLDMQFGGTITAAEATTAAAPPPPAQPTQPATTAAPKPMSVENGDPAHVGAEPAAAAGGAVAMEQPTVVPVATQDAATPKLLQSFAFIGATALWIICLYSARFFTWPGTPYQPMSLQQEQQRGDLMGEVASLDNGSREPIESMVTADWDDAQLLAEIIEAEDGSDDDEEGEPELEDEEDDLELDDDKDWEEDWEEVEDDDEEEVEDDEVDDDEEPLEDEEEEMEDAKWTAVAAKEQSRLDALMEQEEALLKDKEALLSQIKGNVTALKQLAQELVETKASLSQNVTEFAENADTLTNAIAQARSKHRKNKNRVDTVVKQLRALMNSEEPVAGTPALDAVRKNLGSNVSAMLIDVSVLELWHVEYPADCPSGSGAAAVYVDEEGNSIANDDHVNKSLAAADAVAIKRKMENFLDVLNEYRNGVFKDASFRESIQQRVVDYIGQQPLPQRTNLTAAAKPNKISRGSGRPATEMKQLVASRLEVERADQTGRIDYAALHNGARVVSTGDRATSRSLVDDLPIFNRVAARMGVAFYGHGPEAALTPTFPPMALGQCWSFEKSNASLKHSAYATLTIQLAKPVFVMSVSVEHPPVEISGQRKSAIRAFRVLGFEDASAQRQPWRLGTFVYDAFDNRRPFRQEYPIPDELDDEDVPRLRAISVAIDSNWGADFACLYRFRVHGRE